jgi:hypothetical protein
MTGREKEIAPKTLLVTAFNSQFLLQLYQKRYEIKQQTH